MTSPAISNPEQSVIRHYFLYWPLAFGGAVSYVNKSERVYGNTGNLFLHDFLSFIFVKKSIISPVMAPVNKRSDKGIATPKVMSLFT